MEAVPSIGRLEPREMLLPGLQTAMAAVIRRVAVDDDSVFPGRGVDLVAEVGRRRMEIENEHQPRPHEGDDLAFGVLVQRVRLAVFKQAEGFRQSDHVAVETGQVSPLVQALAGVLYDAFKGILRYL